MFDAGGCVSVMMPRFKREISVPMFSALATHPCVPLQKSPAKKLSHALSKSLSCASSREPLHPMFPEMPEKPLNLAHIV